MSIVIEPVASRSENRSQPGKSSWHALPLAWDMTCVGLWLIGACYQTTGRIEAMDFGTMVQFMAAVGMVIPLFVRMMLPRFQDAADIFSDQLVLLAICGSLAAGEYAAAVLVPVIMNLGHWFENRSIQGTQDAIDGLKRLHARSATVVDGGVELRVPAESLAVGQVLLVHPGDCIAADGVVRWGVSSVDEASITGESRPRDVEPGDTVFAGTINLAGLLRLEITQTGENTSLGRISAMLHEAAQSKAPIVKLLERYAGFYVPTVMLVAAAVFFHTRDIQRVIAIFIVSCPCALVLSGPAAMIAALAKANQRGILIKNTKFLESLASADTVVFDKTGTLTHGEMSVVELFPTASSSCDELLRVAAMCAQYSQHPLSRAVWHFVQDRSIATGGEPIEVRELPGQGVEVVMGAGTWRLGNPLWLRRLGLTLDLEPSQVGSLVAISDDDRFVGYVVVADRIREEASEAVEMLRQSGIDRLLLLTGDRRQAATPVGELLGMDQVIAEALPSDKYQTVLAENQSGRKVIVVGDGINDALALAAGNVGIAMGARGSDVAIQSADIALMSNDLRRIVEAVRLSRITQRTVHRNVLIAVLSTLLMLVLSSWGKLPPVAGAVLHNVGTVLVLIHSATLLKVRLHTASDSTRVET